MGRRVVGEFSPPRELVAISAPRVSGLGTIEVSDAGLAFDGRVLGVEPPIPPWSSIGVLLVALLVNRFVPNAEQVLLPATLLLVMGILWLRYRAEFGRTGVHPIPWGEVEHVARLPSAPDVLAFVLARPVAGRGSPEQVFFAPTEGVDVLVAAIREVAPPSLGWDLESAERPAEPEEDPDGGAPDEVSPG